MNHFWTTVTAPQATIIASTLTVLAAVIGVLLGAWLFSGRVKNLKSAIEASEDILNAHKGDVEGALSDIKEQIGSLLETVGQVRGTIADQQSVENAGEEIPIDQPRWTDTRSAWEDIRDELERISANPNIDGRTRAKYARIDRRSYSDLIRSVAQDGHLGANQGLFEEALAIWMRYRNGRSVPSVADLQRLREIGRTLIRPEH